MMKPTKADKLRSELLELRAIQNAPGYQYDGAIEPRLKGIARELLALNRRKAQAKAHRELMFDLNGHHGRA